MVELCSGTVKTKWKYSVFKKLGLTILEPLSPGERLAFWAMPIAARVKRIALMAALITLLHMATQNSRATDLDGCHNAVLRV